MACWKWINETDFEFGLDFTLTIRRVCERNTDRSRHVVDQWPGHDVRSNYGFRQSGLDIMTGEVIIEFFQHHWPQKMHSRALGSSLKWIKVVAIVRGFERPDDRKVLCYWHFLTFNSIAQVRQEFWLRARERRGGFCTTEKIFFFNFLFFSFWAFLFVYSFFLFWYLRIVDVM